jgi:hypothetical protein
LAPWEQFGKRRNKEEERKKRKKKKRLTLTGLLMEGLSGSLALISVLDNYTANVKWRCR